MVGCPRSGTTALTKLLHSHPNVVIGLERYRWLLRGLERQGSFAQLGPALFRAERFLAFRPTETTVMPDSDQAREHYELARDRLQRGQVRIIGDKVPPTVAITQALAGAFPGARFVFLYRDPYRVAASFAARAARPDSPWPAEAGASVAIDYWHEAFVAADTLTARVGADGLFIVRHESLFSGDEDCMRAMFRFIGADVPGEVLDWFRRTVKDWPAREQAARRLSPTDEQLVADELDRRTLERFDRLFERQFDSSVSVA